MGEDPKNHLVPIPCHGHRHLPLDHIAQFPIYAGLEHFQGIHNFSGQHVSVLHHPQKREFLIPNLNLLSFSLKPFPFVLLLHGLIKIPSPALFIHWKAPLRSSGAFSPPDWTTPSLSACVYRSRAPLIIFVILIWTHSKRSVSYCVLLLGPPELDASLQVGSHEDCKEGQNPLNLLVSLLLMQPKIQLAFWPALLVVCTTNLHAKEKKPPAIFFFLILMKKYGPCKMS